MKQGWEVKKLVDVCLVERGSFPRPIEKYFTTSEDGVNWIKIGDTKGVDKYIYSTKEKITKEGAEKSRYVKEGDFLLSNSMSFGRPFIMKTDGYIHDGWFVLRLHDFIDTEYFYHLLSSPTVQNQIQSLAAGAIVKNISGDLVKKVIVAYPPLPEQQRIVAILDEAFAAITKAKANAEQNLKNAKELFDSYLQSVFENKGEGWEEKALSKFCEVKDGTHDSPKYVKEGIPFVTQKNIRQDGLSFTDTKFITETDHSKFYKRSNVTFGDILISMIGANRGMACIVDDKRVFSIKNVGLIKESENINKHFLLYYLKSPLAMRYVLYMSNGGAQEFIGLTALRNFPIYCPPLKEQQNIVQKLDALSAQTKKLEAIYQQHLNDLDELKKSILQKAFKGELTTVMLQMNLDLAPPPTMELCGISQRLTNRQFHVI